jgi:hypothetical protein
MKHIIRTHDRLTFKSCREKWNFGSKIREDWEPFVAAKPLDFGIAIHAAAEVLYDPATWGLPRDVVEATAMAKFLEVCGVQKKQTLHYRNSEDLAVEVEIDFTERLELGKAMLQQFFKWSRQHDDFTPLAVEIEFEVPICVPADLAEEINAYEHDGIYVQFKAVWSDENQQFELYARSEATEQEWWPVVYQGKVDLLLQDKKTGLYWIDDHKTAAQMSSLDWLPLDDQIGSYVWALSKMLKLPIAGFMYTEIFKKILHQPMRLKAGGLSRNKQQDTNEELYLEAIAEEGLRVEDYADFLQFLRENPKVTVRRERVWRTPEQLRIFERRLCLEAIDMLNDPSIYPNPSKMACNGCWFYAPCLAKQDGQDAQFILINNY